MSFMRKLKRLIHKGGVKLGLVQQKSLSSITDDPRIKVPAEEYDRIRKAKQYYQDKLDPVEYWTTKGKQKRPLNSLNVLKSASQALASLMFNERCSIKVNDSKLQNLLDDIFKDNNYYLDQETHLETWIALGSGAIRPYVENDKIKLSWANATEVYPLEANTTKVDQIAISRRLQKIENNNAVYYTLLEFHQWGNWTTDEQGRKYRPYIITNELYRSGDPNTIGEQVPLDYVDEYAGLSSTTTINYLEKPLFAFYRNAGANNKNLVSPLGIGLCDNWFSTVDDINMVHDGFEWEVKTGYRRVSIPRSWVRRQQNMNGHQIPEDQQYFWDPNDAVFVPVNSEDDTSSFKDLSINIRNEQYEGAMDFFLRELENDLKLSPGTFTVTPSGVQTATEVVTNNSKTYQTRSSYLTMLEKTIDQLAYAIAELLQNGDLWSDGKARWNGDLDSLVITPDFNDGVFVDQEAQRSADLQAVQASVMPKIQFIMRNYDLSEEEAQKWLQQIQDEQSPTPPDQEMDMLPGGEVNNERQGQDKQGPDAAES
ncbi:phage portal protein [Lactobacillus crispatus]|uniref:Phage portal protein n=1 Tax=Lactobacillus crispatus TaxID=47770 RepID=A0A7H9EA61_9LACO|nr:phage portal protein [Lactobacillus crispatus]QLL74349.1 phage portal protein [Lactobacillus crispatus]